MDLQSTIQMLLDFDFGLGIGSALGTRWDLQAVAIKRDGIVIGHGAGMLEAKVVFCAITALARVRRPSLLGQVSLGSVGCTWAKSSPGPGWLPPEWMHLLLVNFYQTILESAPQPLDASLGLGASGSDQLNT